MSIDRPVPTAADSPATHPATHPGAAPRAFARRLAALATVALAIGAGTACTSSSNAIRGSGVPVTRVIDLPGSFESIELGGAATFQVEPGPTTRVTIVIDDNLAELLDTTATQDRLVIRPRSGSNFAPVVDARYFVTLSDPSRLRSLRIGGALEGSVAGIDHDDFELSLHGASRSTISGRARDASIDIHGASRADLTAFTVADRLLLDVHGASNAEVAAAPRTTVDVHGASSLELVGPVESLVAEVHGTARFRSRAARIAEAAIRSHGNGSVRLGEVGTLDARASGTSSIDALGVETVVQESTSGMARISHD